MDLKNKYFEGPLSRKSRECRCEIIFSTHRMDQTTKGCGREGRGGNARDLRESRGFRIMHRSISGSRDEDFAVFDSEWRRGPELKRHPGPALSANVGFTSGTL